MAKTKKNKKLSTLIVVTLLALVAVGAMLAYLQDDDSDVNVMTLGNVQIEQIEQERDATGNLVDFQDNKPAFPAVGPIAWADKGVDVNGTEYKVFSDELKNVVDKIVTVKNTGKSPAYVRTLVAIEAPEGDPNDLIHVNINPDGLNQTSWIPITVNNVEYVYSCFTYDAALASGAISAPSLMQVFLDSAATNEDVAKFGETWEILVLSQAGQTEGFSGAEAALNTMFGAPEAIADNGKKNAVNWFEKVLADDAAAKAPDAWDGTADTSWYNDTDTEFVIETAEQLAGFAKLVDEGNTFAGKTIKLGQDIDLYYVPEGSTEPKSFDPIGYGYNTVFKGTFDGQEHTISNLYQNGWDLGLAYSTEGGGLFASVVDATIKDVNIDNAEIVMECIDMGILVGYSYGNCTYENINVTNSTIANYQRYTGGVVGEVNGTQTFKNVDVKDTVVSSLWGDFDCSLGGIVGGKYGEAALTFDGCDVECEINTYNDVTSSYQWYAYRRAGMLIGNSEETKTVEGRTEATATYLTATNCTVTYEDWANYHYCEFAGTSWPYVRVEAGNACGQNSAYSNPRYGVATDSQGNKVVDDSHVHNAGEDHNILLTFDQLYGGGQGVYGGTSHDGVKVIYNNK